MAKTRKQPAKETKCQKNIAMLLSLMGFKDDNPAASAKVNIMLAKLRKIQEKAANFKKPGHSTSKKPFKKFTFKCGGKRSTVFLNQPLTPPHSNNVQNNNEDDGGRCMGLTLRNFIASMGGGSEATLVIEKELTSSDVNKGLGRLLIPRMHVIKNSGGGFLTSDEKRKLGKGNDTSVPVFDPKRREWTVNLKKWNMNTEVYVLKTGWNGIVEANGLKQGVVIKVWAFRVNQQLRFAVEEADGSIDDARSGDTISR